MGPVRYVWRYVRRRGLIATLRTIRGRVLTSDKTRRGVLPVPVEHTAIESAGDGRRCDGCSETINPAAKLATVTHGKWLRLWFHGDCYRAWLVASRVSTPNQAFAKPAYRPSSPASVSLA
jgi:hypothetical protein